MVTVRLPAKLTEDYQLVIDVPRNLAPGDVQVIIEAAELDSAARQDARMRGQRELAAVGLLSDTWDDLSDEDDSLEDEDVLLDLPPGLMGKILDEERDDRG